MQEVQFKSVVDPIALNVIYMKCDAEYAGCHIIMSTLMQASFKSLSFADHHGH
jgi:hypothetical protein